MLQSPTAEELDQLRKAVAIMTPSEKLTAQKLTVEQIQKIADDASVDPGLLAIFFNGYALQDKKTNS